MRRVALLLLVASVASAEPRELALWHSYRGAEEKALDASIALFREENPDVRIDVLAVPYEVLASKLTTTIQNGNGPDVFIFAHERLGGWARSGIVRPLDAAEAEDARASFLPETLPPLTFEQRLYGYPLAFKSVALFHNRALVHEPPRTTDELLATARKHSGNGRFGLAYEAGNFFHHAAWHLGFGGTLIDAAGRMDFRAPGSVAALAFARDLTAEGLVPQEPTGALVSRLFNDGKAAMVVSGPWFIGEIEQVDFGVAPLPIVSATGKAASPLLTDEAVFVSEKSRSPAEAVRVARFLAGTRSALLRGTVGRQLVADRAAWDDPRLANDGILQAFRAQLATATPTDNRPEMRNVWEPAQLALRKTLRGDATPELAALAAQRRFDAIARPPPPESPVLPYALVGLALVLGLAALLLRRVQAIARGGQRRMALLGAAWVAPALLASFVLVFVPFGVGLVMAFFSHANGTWTFVGFSNFTDILLARSFAPTEPLSFYYALVVTVLWTALNLALHVGVGLWLALLLNRQGLALKGVYRVLLIVPWAVPNYITALLWKGLFHKQYGAINGLLEALGIGGVAWFSSFGTAFFANVCANAWLGFPFMMVVSLGALQSIPQDLYEAADIDGASRWDKFRHVTLPLLLPALVPSVLLGTVWTFNQFNVVYLVSGGEPDNATDILISEAYRWAFARQEQYGYAAAYAALIFVLLLGWSAVSTRAARVAESMR